MEKPRPSRAAWAAVGIGVAAYELLCPDGETLTEGFREGMQTRLGRAALTGATLVTAGHLVHAIPDKYDPFEQGLSKVRRRVVRKIYKTIVEGENQHE
jgi:hypothetical protein